MMCTWAHVESRSTPKVGGDAVLRSKAEVRQLDGPSIILDEDILRLEIAMVHSIGMAVANGVQNLKKDVLGLRILTHVIPLLRDLGEEITFRAVLKDNKSAIVGFEDLLHGHHVRMLAGLVMEADLAVLKAPLPGVEAKSV